MWAGTSVSCMDCNPLRDLCAWLYKVTSSLNSFLNAGLQWYLLFKERCCCSCSCSCSDSLAEVRQLCWSIHGHNSSFLLGKLYQDHFQTKDKVKILPSKQADKGKIPQDLFSFFRFDTSCKPRGRGLSLSLPLPEEAVWVWGLSPPLLLSNSGTFSCLSQQRAREGNMGMSPTGIESHSLGMPWSHLTQSKDFAL